IRFRSRLPSQTETCDSAPENKPSFFAEQNVSIPVAVSAFLMNSIKPPRSCAEPAYTKLIYYKNTIEAGTCRAREQPTTVVRGRASGLQTVRNRKPLVDRINSSSQCDGNAVLTSTREPM